MLFSLVVLRIVGSQWKWRVMRDGSGFEHLGLLTACFCCHISFTLVELVNWRPAGWKQWNNETVNHTDQRETVPSEASMEPGVWEAGVWPSSWWQRRTPSPVERKGRWALTNPPPPRDTWYSPRFSITEFEAHQSTAPEKQQLKSSNKLSFQKVSSKYHVNISNWPHAVTFI